MIKRSEDRKLNFGAGPASIPEEVLQEASEAILDYNASGLSVLEIPHRGKLFDDILDESKQLVRELCALSSDYEILWLHGGGRLQFSMIPMNFLGAGGAAYIDSGHWAQEAIAYAGYYGEPKVIASSAGERYASLPEWPASIDPSLSYLHFTTNNTIYGTQWPDIPLSPVPLIADMSSDMLSTQRSYSNCAMFYAVAQKNLGAAGTTLVVLHKDMLARTARRVPPMLNYEAQVRTNSVLNTPPVFAIYTALLMLRWTKRKGIDIIQKDNEKKASILYAEIDRNSLFAAVVDRPDHRSKMNVCFRAKNPENEQLFSDFCTQNNITGIDGHRTVGGFRVSLYNAITIQQVERLITLMQAFEDDHKKD